MECGGGLKLPENMAKRPEAKHGGTTGEGGVMTSGRQTERKLLYRLQHLPEVDAGRES
jgi:hypothetical protein